VSAPSLSIVIPAYNEAARLPATLGHIVAYLERQAQDAEILVVDDGSRDGTAERAFEASAGRAHVLRNERNRGKGYSVRRGMLAASGARRLMTDADLSTPIEELPPLMARLDAGDDIAIGSRAIAGARVEVHQPLFRESVGRVFNLLVRLLALPGLHDTQCGFKLFTAVAAGEAFGAARLDGFCFDVEALYIARLRGRRVVEVPVRWRNDDATRVTLSRGLLAFADLARIRWNGRLGRYGRSSPART
jgi:dolichyl-phosphate beta-glucosyltransferase